jgi:hypothetical protein
VLPLGSVAEYFRFFSQANKVADAGLIACEPCLLRLDVMQEQGLFPDVADIIGSKSIF